MKNFADICLIAAMVVIIYFNEGWWQLMVLFPFLILLVRIESGKDTKKKIDPLEDYPEKMKYEVIASDGEKFDVECEYPVQCVDDWAHFTDEITEYGYHPHAAFYKPRRVTLITEDNVSPFNRDLN